MPTKQRTRKQFERDNRKAIQSQLDEVSEAAELVAHEEHEREKQDKLEDRRRMIVGGFDPDATPAQRFSSLADFDAALLDVDFLDSDEARSVYSIRDQLAEYEERRFIDSRDFDYVNDWQYDEDYGRAMARLNNLD